ncbi:HAD family hydrolase [Brucella anthropi]|uniref:HAD family hydrolase n=1 Tax=Brucella anthropi TaxID=529 RepID=A0A6L3YYL5_BRUAN|nr:HAD family hydrolase [Brucella anthropi]KAB2758406.1 HAD family hydrolase [Brucella anthropi]
MAQNDRSIAFFDVDETLIATKSMFDFVGFLGERETSVNAAAIAAEMRQRSASGEDRASINLRFWQNFAGLGAETVRAYAGEWFANRRDASPTFFIPAGMERLDHHRSRGDIIAFVSGSACDILEPVARHLGADHVLATRLMEQDGVYTGAIIPPVMIGEGKQIAARQLAQSLGCDLADCHGYGDHLSDLPLLELVGHPSAIGAEGELAETARRRGWPVLPGIETLRTEGAFA